MTASFQRTLALDDEGLLKPTVLIAQSKVRLYVRSLLGKGSEQLALFSSKLNWLSKMKV
jgi:hypothetical protein